MPGIQSSSNEKIADALAETGYAVVDGFLTKQEVTDILNTDEFKNSKLHFRKAATGKWSKQVNEGIRGDYIEWIDPTSAPAGTQVYIQRLKHLITFLNRSLFLSLQGVELHRTVYPVGAFYKRHLDQFRSDDHRKLSVICYLNDHWKLEEGGQLRMYPSGKVIDVLPEAGRLVCFRSDLIEHEVLEATRERLSLTGWAIDCNPKLRQ